MAGGENMPRDTPMALTPGVDVFQTEHVMMTPSLKRHRPDLLIHLGAALHNFSQLRYMCVICRIIYVNLTQAVNRPFYLETS